MGAGNDKFVKYPKTPHLWGSKMAAEDKMLSEMGTRKLLAMKGVDFVWESKIDGTNVGVSFDDKGDLVAQNRGHILVKNEHPQYNVFRSWAYTVLDRLKSVLGTRHIMFGEWCYARHTIAYTSLPHYFLEFDVYDRETSKFLSTPIRRKMLKELVEDGVLAQVPVVFPDDVDKGYGDTGKMSLEEARRFMGMQDSQYGEVKAEGLYLKVERKGEVIERYKMVRDEFVQKIIDDNVHWRDRAIEVQGLATGVDIFNPRSRE